MENLEFLIFFLNQWRQVGWCLYIVSARQSARALLCLISARHSARLGRVGTGLGLSYASRGKLSPGYAKPRGRARLG